MYLVLEYLTSAMVCPAAVLYVYLLNDRWRVRAVWRWLLFAVCGPLSLFLVEHLTVLPMSVRIYGIWVVMLPCCWAFSSIRDGRFFFVLTTGILFSYLCTVTSSMLSAACGIHRGILRLALNALFLFLGRRYFCPAFWETYHLLKRGWLAFALMPASLLVIFLSLLVGTDYTMRYTFSYVRAFSYLLALLTVVFYCASFLFFRKLGRWQQLELGNAVLSSQIAAYARQRARRQQADDFGRILRHDLRHYLRILSSCLRNADAETALESLQALRQHMQNARHVSQEAHHDE